MKAWSPDWYHWLRLVVAESEAYELAHDVPVHFLAEFFTICIMGCGLRTADILGSPPTSSVPLKTAGAPTEL